MGAGALLVRRKMIIRKLTECGAFSEEKAVTFREAGVFNPNAFQGLNRILEKQNIIIRTKDNKYFLNR